MIIAVLRPVPDAAAFLGAHVALVVSFVVVFVCRIGSPTDRTHELLLIFIVVKLVQASSTTKATTPVGVVFLAAKRACVLSFWFAPVYFIFARSAPA